MNHLTVLVYLKLGPVSELILKEVIPLTTWNIDEPGLFGRPFPAFLDIVRVNLQLGLKLLVKGVFAHLFKAHRDFDISVDRH